ncbi:MAG: hypothetical protein COY80_01340 [Candidatus Pacebacteria bacterium CG_4_10_14_0_8_um_filter_42_14]|nr:MAG: hypothetical protein COY80_01340 [Candidatus Pacebacteria bacterium CG_4_10_14_0_8_um_filter_42_14]
MSEDLYQEQIIEAAYNPANMGELGEFDVATREVSNSCGDAFSVQIKLSTDKTVVEDLKWQGNGCAIGMAAMSLVSSACLKKPTSLILKWGEKEMLESLSLDQISPSRSKCMMLGLRTIQSCLKKL